MSFSLNKNSKRDVNRDTFHIIRNRSLQISDFSNNIKKIKLQDYKHNSNIYIPKYIPLTNKNDKEIILFNDTNYKIILHTHLKIILHPKTKYILDMNNADSHKVTFISVHKITSFNKNFIDVSNITLYPYTIKCSDILPNPSDYLYHQLTFTGEGGNVYLPRNKEIDTFFGECVTYGYNIVFKVNNCSSGNIIIHLQDQKEGLNFNNKQYVIEPNRVCEISILMSSRINLLCIAGIRRIV